MSMTKEEKTAYKRKFNEEKYSRIGLYLSKGEKEIWQSKADSLGISLNELIKRAMYEYIK